MNVLNALPKSVQSKAKADLHDIWVGPAPAPRPRRPADFLRVSDRSCLKLSPGQFAACSGPARTPGLTLETHPHLESGLRPFRAETRHRRVSGTPFTPIESTFATVRHRTRRTKDSPSRKTGLAMAFRLMMSAQKKWRKLDGRNRLPEVIEGLEFHDGLRHLQTIA